MTGDAPLPTFDPDADDPYPADDLARALLVRLRSRRDLLTRIINPTARSIRYWPYDAETGDIRSAFDKIWDSATEAYDLTKGPETWYTGSRRVWAFPDAEIGGWHDLPTLDLSWTDDWEWMRLPKYRPGKMFACTRCSYATHRGDRARRHDREAHPGESVDASVPIESSAHFELLPEEQAASRRPIQHGGAGQHSLDAYADGGASER